MLAYKIQISKVETIDPTGYFRIEVFVSTAPGNDGRMDKLGEIIMHRPQVEDLIADFRKMTFVTIYDEALRA